MIVLMAMTAMSKITYHSPLPVWDLDKEFLSDKESNFQIYETILISCEVYLRHYWELSIKKALIFI